MASSGLKILVLLLTIIIGAIEVEALLLVFYGGSTNCCSSCIQCPGSHQCIRKSQLCDGVSDCENGEEEATSWCSKYDSPDRCPDGSYNGCGGYCRTWDEICRNSRSTCSSPHNDYDIICPAFNSGKLPSSLIVATTPKPTEVPAVEISMEEVASYVSAANCSLDHPLNSSQPSCPMLYSTVGDACLAMLPFQLTWPEAQAACGAISGHLVEFEFVDGFSDLVQHLITNDHTSDFWTGGFFDIKKEAWTWSSGLKMPTATPFWTLRHSESCTSRQSVSFGPVPGCFHYQQAPANQETGYCAALQFENFYYISDEGCFQKKKPICAFKTNEA